jgi:hypothetical protein
LYGTWTYDSVTVSFLYVDDPAENGTVPNQEIGEGGTPTLPTPTIPDDYDFGWFYDEEGTSLMRVERSMRILRCMVVFVLDEGDDDEMTTTRPRPTYPTNLRD